jgi:hypothetical protein
MLPNVRYLLCVIRKWMSYIARIRLSFLKGSSLLIYMLQRTAHALETAHHAFLVSAVLLLCMFLIVLFVLRVILMSVLKYFGDVLFRVRNM